MDTTKTGMKGTYVLSDSATNVPAVAPTVQATPCLKAPSSMLAVRSLASVELFAGAGGLALGLSAAGFAPKLVIELDENCCETLRANDKAATCGWPVEQKDVRDLDYTELGKVDLLSAGAPCQPFSVGGRLRGETDSRNMFPEVIRAVREIQPRAFMFENVRGLLFPRARSYFDYLIAELRMPSRKRRPDEDWLSHCAALQAIPESEHEYWVDWRVLNAADFGLAQNRPRLVVIGLEKSEGDFTWPEPTHSRASLIDALYGDDYWEWHEVDPRVRDAVRETLRERPDEATGKRWTTLRDLAAELGAPDTDPDDESHVLVPGARLYAKHTGSSLDWPAKTVKAGVHGCPGGEHILIDDHGEHRYLTLRECALLQGFPRNYVLPAKRTRAMRQLGNAVPVALAQAVGTGLARTLLDA